MPSEHISYPATNKFSKLILDYLDKKEKVRGFYNRFPEIENFKGQIDEKKASFPNENRQVLVKVLEKQYENVAISEATQNNIQLLKKATTFTITTGHQLNLFTGPLYFLYKIISAINLSKTLKSNYPKYDFVSVYWMATEDHDFQEIAFFNLNGKKFKWNHTQPTAGKDAVGNLSTEGLQDVFELFSAEIGGGENAEYLKELFKKAYLQHDNLTNATRYLANELFKEYGLVILDADEKDLKKEFINGMRQELFEKVSHNATNPTAEKLIELGYNAQVNPREINLFYLKNGLRERIIERDGEYFVNTTNLHWTKMQIKKELEKNPEHFSPNVMMRPVYQEVILPDLCYIGGGGELAYWFELKMLFEKLEIPFPILLLRNSALIETEKQNEKRKKLDISQAELFLKPYELINRKVRKISNIDIDFSIQKEHLVKQFEGMYKLANKTDKSFLGAVKAQEVKQLKGLEHLERRLLKAQKRKLKDQVERINLLQNELFPHEGLQERYTNFSEIYLKYGKDFIPSLIANLDPLNFQFNILTFE